MSTSAGATPPEPPEERRPGPLGPCPNAGNGTNPVPNAGDGRNPNWGAGDGTNPGAQGGFDPRLTFDPYGPPGPGAGPGSGAGPYPGPRSDGRGPHAVEEYAPVWGQGRPEGSGANTPSWNTGAAARESVPVGVAVALVAVGALVLLLVVGLLVFVGLKTFSAGGGDDPAPESTGEVATPREEAGASSSGQAADGTTVPSPGAKADTGAHPLPAPTGKALFHKSGTFAESSLTEGDPAATITVPSHDGPMLLVWKAGGTGKGLFFVSGKDKTGGTTSMSTTLLRSGQTGSRLINEGGLTRDTGVLYAQGNKGMTWEVTGYPFSSVPEVQRGATVAGNGSAVFRIPAGASTGYTLSVPGQDKADVPTVEVYPADDLSLPDAHQWHQAPADLDVTVGEGDRYVVVETEQAWSFTAH